MYDLRILEAFWLYGHEKNIMKIARMLEMLYTTVYSIMKEYEEMGLIKRKKIGRENKVILTEKGEQVLLMLKKIKELANI